MTTDHIIHHEGRENDLTALDKLIAEAERQGMERAAGICDDADSNLGPYSETTLAGVLAERIRAAMNGEN